MTLLFKRAVKGPATHAFVVGVGDFPYAAGGPNQALIDVPALPSAADSAKFMCDWLYLNRDHLAAPLASLEVLISDSPAAANRYQWAFAKAVDRATFKNVEKAGKRWLTNFPENSRNTAFFYGCGHGASLAAEPVLFLDELNIDDIKSWPHIHAASLARSLRLHRHIEDAYIFIDACGQKLKEFEVCPVENRPPAVFYPVPAYGAVGANKVMLMSAAPEGVLAYDAPLPTRFHQPPNAGVPIGRFTQTLVLALNGASIRPVRGRWTVNSTGLRDDLKQLKQFYFPHLTDYPQNPVVPVVATTDPLDRIAAFELCFQNAPPPPTRAGLKHDPVRLAWFSEVPPSHTSLYAIAFSPTGSFANPFTPNQPQFDLQVTIP